MAKTTAQTERQKKKAERRQKQREANIPRARKMHLARIEYEKLNPPCAETNIKPQPPHLNIGCSGWFYWDWKGKFYPAELPTNQWFEYYAGHFKTVELNASFYSWPTIATVKSWARQAKSRNFVYTVKVCELITHIKQFKGTKALVKDFGFIADLLGPRMGCFLFQLPPSFRYTPARLRTITSQLDPARRNVVEFRHSSWWNEDVYKAFRKAGIIFCSCSGPKLPGDLLKTADDIYIRFHGTERWYRHNYSDEELKQWAEKMKASDAKRIWAYFNNDYDGYAIQNAATLTQLLKRK
jgi:uncharacterized protein YecE (DUF72 family)